MSVYTELWVSRTWGDVRTLTGHKNASVNESFHTQQAWLTIPPAGDKVPTQMPPPHNTHVSYTNIYTCHMGRKRHQGTTSVYSHFYYRALVASAFEVFGAESHQNRL